MHDDNARSALVLSEGDADAIAQGVAALMELIWEIFARRRLQLQLPTDDSDARVGICPGTGHTQTLNELF